MKSRMVWKLAARFAAVLLLFTTVLGGVYAAAFRQHTVAVNRETMEAQAVSIAQTLASFQEGVSGGGRGGRGGYGAYLRFVNALATAEVWIVDTDRTLLAPGRERAGQDSLPARAASIRSYPVSRPGERSFPACWTPPP